MICKQCQTNNEHDAKFCVACGTPLNASTHTSESETIGTIPRPETEVAAASEPTPEKPSAESSSKPLRENRYITNTVDASKNYWQYVKNAFTTPTANMKQATEGDALNGMITMGILSIILALSAFLRVFYNRSFGQHFIKPWIIYLGTISFLVVAVFLVSKLMRTTESFMQIVGRVGAGLLIPTAIYTLATVFNLIKTYSFAGYLSTIGLASITAMISLLIYSFNQQAEKKFDPLFGILIALSITGLGNILLIELLL